MKTPGCFMVIDDDPVSNMLCKFAIKRFFGDADIQLFTDATKAIAAIGINYCKNNSNTPTLILLDINMPVMNGWEFLEEFQHFSKDVRSHFMICMLSSSVDTRDKERAGSDPSVAGFFSKPLNVETCNIISEQLT